MCTPDECRLPLFSAVLAFSAGACARARLPCTSSASLAMFWLTRMSYQVAMAMVAGRPGCRCQQARLTGEKRGRRGRWPRRLRHRRDFQGERRRTRGGRGSGRRARVQVPALRREPRRSEGGVHTSRPDCILVLSSRSPVLITVTFLNIVRFIYTGG